MTATTRLGIIAITAIFLVLSITIYFSPTRHTGLFLEEHGDCTTVIGGVHSYRYCGFDVPVVRKEVSFKQGRTDIGFIPSEKQQHNPFYTSNEEGYHRLKSHWPQKQTGPIASRSLHEEPFSQQQYASRRHLFDDPYESSPYDSTPTHS